MARRWDIALVVTITADIYSDALQEAEALAEGIGMQDEISISAVTHYDRDSEGQRVLYLHDEKQPIV